MLADQRVFHKGFARVSPVFLLLICLFLCAPISQSATQRGSSKRNASHPEDSETRSRRQAASTQYARAQDLRAALNSKPAEKRSLAEYKQVVSSYRRVYLITPRAAEVPDSLLAVAELYTEMGDRFGRSYYQLAVDSYQFLLHEYPTSHFGQDAMMRVARLQKDQLNDAAQASKTYEAFLKKYPHSTRKREAQESLAELALLQRSEEPAAPAQKSVAGADAEKSANAAESSREVSPDAVRASRAANPGSSPRLRRISTSASAGSTRVTIDLEDLVEYASARIRNPDRIFFDLHAARLTPELARQNIHVDGGLLTDVRVAQNQAGVVRVVLTVNGVKDYSASLLSNPPQLVIDLYPDSRGAVVRSAKAKRNAPQIQAAAEEVNVDTVAAREDNSAVEPVATTSAKAEPPTTVQGQGPSPASAAGSTVASPGSSVPAPRNSSLVANNGAGAKSRSKALKAGAGKPDLVQPVAVPQPTRDGQSTLTRTLGLKIGRIVIDPGHGGHDTGTIGPTGLMEKDLCLDVAVRLGKIIQQRLPGADVVFTRSDDTFIPLEERTRIANEAKADLFISIHANSSHDHAARGIETYYLNLKGSPDAMEVAARENATAQQSVHDLEDLVKKIARSEKIDESREFAADIQESLAKRIQKMNRTVKDRGVRKAPFVVLIGADMPSILTEISFLSNPADEQLLKKPEHRQRVAEGLYQGVASYLQSLNSMTLNAPSKSLGATPVSASVEQSRNQR
jgi:N-acetylmuramoyl-L-alanine amidase